ncbi:MAG TPA: hypothetical protein VJR92_10200 [Gemmatimonadaceae bacterium]|nr:hypothetical protein [Gemmatimonadaceae bacterium]
MHSLLRSTLRHGSVPRQRRAVAALLASAFAWQAAVVAIERCDVLASYVADTPAHVHGANGGTPTHPAPANSHQHPDASRATGPCTTCVVAPLPGLVADSPVGVTHDVAPSSAPRRLVSVVDAPEVPPPRL